MFSCTACSEQECKKEKCNPDDKFILINNINFDILFFED
jgi:hypothetical protein